MSIEVTGPIHDRFDEILTPEALDFLADLHRRFDARRRELLARREERQRELSAGGLEFLDETKDIREAEWRVAEPAPGLVDRRVEITGPTDAKMTINALNSGAKVWLADHEDANTLLWENVVSGQLNLRDAIDRALRFTSPEGKTYELRDGEPATIVFRPRGWHLTEKHILIDGERMSGSLVDFGLYLFHCGRRQLDRGSGPYFYLPKMESHLEARLWNDVFVRAQELLGLPLGTIRATVLIETFPAAFEMEEILYELREHSAGLNAGRWDYMFSVIKRFRTRGADFLLPDRNAVTMTVPFRGRTPNCSCGLPQARRARDRRHGGVHPQPARPRGQRGGPRQGARRQDPRGRRRLRRLWVAHLDLVPICREVFDGVLGDRPNQLDRVRDDVAVTAAQLLAVGDTPGQRTEAGLRNAVSVGIQYLASWLRGSGAVTIFNLMEDAATAEISRSQVWQWLHNDVTLDDTEQPVTRELVERVADEEIAALGGDPADYAQARALFMEVAVADDFVEFLTLPAYERMP